MKQYNTTRGMKVVMSNLFGSLSIIICDWHLLNYDGGWVCEDGSRDGLQRLLAHPHKVLREIAITRHLELCGVEELFPLAPVSGSRLTASPL